MIRHLFQRGLLAGLLVLSLTPLVHAGDSHPPVSRGTVLTITALDPNTHMATLQADDGGQEFQMPASAFLEGGGEGGSDLVTSSRPAAPELSAVVVTTFGACGMSQGPRTWRAPARPRRGAHP